MPDNDVSFAGYTRGFLFSPDGWFLRFMINPSEMEKSKSADWKLLNIPGMNRPVITYAGGNAKEISMKLFFDTSDSSMQSGMLMLNDFRLSGVLGIEAVLDNLTFNRQSQRKGTTSLSVVDKINPFGNQEKPDFAGVFRPPPDVFFIWGIQWFWVRIKGYRFVERKFSRVLMFPNQLETTLELIVVESGIFSALQLETDTIYGKVETITGAAELSIDLVDYAVSGVKII